MNKFGIIAHIERPHIKEAALKIIDWANANKVDCHICGELASLIERKDISRKNNELWKSCDVFIALGGDGTMLSASRAAGDHGIPVLGVNLGGVGFLTEITQEQIEEALVRLKNDDFQLEERMILEASFPHKEFAVTFALNDVVIDHADNTRMAKLDLFSNNEFVCPYSSDGLIVATPTGSTAYSLSAGGPVLHPLMDAIIVSPVSPHTLALRPIIFSKDDVLKIRIGPSDMKHRVSVDGQTIGYLSAGEEALVRKANHKLKLIKFEDKSFYKILRTKLHWGARPLSNM